jgi:parallel beta-helix repeat protein
MSSVDRFEQLLADVLAETAPSREPDRLVPEILRAARGEPRRPRWLALIKEPPMRLSSRVVVGSPVARVAYVAILTLVLVVITAGAVVTGASLLPSPELSGPPAIVVDQGGDGDALTITEGVAMAGAGDTVLVKPGTYAESIVISADITLKGDGTDRAAVVLEFAADGPTHPWVPCCEAFAYGILLLGSGARIESLTVHGPAEGVAVQIDGGSPVIDDIDIVLEGDSSLEGRYFKRSALRIQGGASPTISNSSWDGYTRVDGGANAPTFTGDTVTTQYIAVAGGGNQPVIRGSTFLEGAGIGWTDSGSAGIAENNDITGSIGVEGASDPTIRGNRIATTTGAAITIASGSTAIVDGNEITDSPHGIQVSGAGATPRISGNTIRGSTGAAISIGDGASPAVGGNTIEGSAVGIEVTGTGAPIFECNTFSGNGTDVSLPADSTVIAEAAVCPKVGSTAP